MLWPGAQLVPPAMGMVADHEPLAQRWKDVPPMQFHAPSLVQGPVMAPAEEPVVVPEELGGALPVPAGVEGEAAAGAEEAALGTDMGVATTLEVGAAPSPPAAEEAGLEPVPEPEPESDVGAEPEAALLGEPEPEPEPSPPAAEVATGVLPPAADEAPPVEPPLPPPLLPPVSVAPLGTQLEPWTLA